MNFLVIPLAVSLPFWTLYSTVALSHPLRINSLPSLVLSNNIAPSNLTGPFAPYGFQTKLTLDQTVVLNPAGVYRNAIQLMYNLAQLPWDRTISFGMYLSLADYNIGITAVSLDPNQFSVSHVVIALQDTVTALSRLRAFFEVTCKVSLKGRLIGRLEIGHHEPVAGAGGGSGSGSGSNVAILNDSDVAGGDASLSTAGQIIDPDDEKLAITYQLYGRIITIQEIFTAVLDALAISAQFEESAECHLIEAVSVMGSCAISVAHSIGQPLEMRYSQATRTLLLLVNEVMVRQRRFGEMWFQVSYDGGVVGEGYVLKVNQVGNATGETASAR